MPKRVGTSKAWLRQEPGMEQCAKPHHLVGRVLGVNSRKIGGRLERKFVRDSEQLGNEPTGSVQLLST